MDCVVCPKCGKQVEALKGSDTPIVINNSASSSSSATASNPMQKRKLPWYLKTMWILIFGMLTGGLYWIIGPIMRISWRSHN